MTLIEELMQIRERIDSIIKTMSAEAKFVCTDQSNGEWFAFLQTLSPRARNCLKRDWTHWKDRDTVLWRAPRSVGELRSMNDNYLYGRRGLGPTVLKNIHNALRLWNNNWEDITSASSDQPCPAAAPLQPAPAGTAQGAGRSLTAPAASSAESAQSPDRLC